jgi:uncharacterized secreted protein with C-terminal beta-propeller domain
VAAPQAAPAAPQAGAAAGPAYSGTNTAVPGVDEPDLVKTDGRRIITVHGAMLRVVDAVARAEVGRLDLASGANDPVRYSTGELLLSGDRVLLISQGGAYYADDLPRPGNPVDGPVPQGGPAPQLTLIDLAGGTPRVAGRYAIDGGVIDARQVGSTVRVVVHSVPALPRPQWRGSPEQYATAMLESINHSTVEDWLPRYRVENGGRVTTGRIDCTAVARPADYTANGLLTVLTFDLARGELGNGEPVSIAADGRTVYSNGPSLYVANDQRWRGEAVADGARPAKVTQRTEIYKFDTSKPGKPSFVGGGAVDGWLLNQYSMSEWDGHLRVATTVSDLGRTNPTSESTVYVLRHKGKDLVETGHVGGLGKGERIYSVRFVGGTGYVVTFRQTDPLYTVDLRDPARPQVRGELKITGYSAYLHPAGDGRLIGIGQEASAAGRTQGTQVSLFDVSDPAAPKRLAQYHMKNAHSEAEFDPHAFLYWPKTGLLVVPLFDYRAPGGPTAGAIALRVSDGAITEIGGIEHPGTAAQNRSIRRSLVIDQTLWTVSQGGLLASDLTTAAKQAWVAFG